MMAELADKIKIAKKTIQAVAHDMAKSAQAANLIYTLVINRVFHASKREIIFLFFRN